MTKKTTCPWWVGYILNRNARKLIHPPLQILSPYLKKNMVALDVGCGMGYFTIPAAELVGSNGNVIAVDLQKKMLTGMLKNAQKANVSEWIIPHSCEQETLCLNEYAGTIDFVMVLKVMHEVHDQKRFTKEIFETLRHEGSLLFVEPKGHVSKSAFLKSLALFEQCGFRLKSTPKITFCRSALLIK